MGIASTTSRALIFGSSYYSGFQIPELWVSQGTSYLSYLLGHLCAADNVGQLLQITMDTLQLHTGFPQPPMTYPYALVSKYIEPSTWSFLQAVQGRIVVSDPWIIQLDHRVNDTFLTPTVSALAETPFLSTADLICFNRCRIYLQVLTLLSDIVDSSGKAITPEIWFGNRSLRKSTLLSPTQVRPGPTSWTLCRRVLSSLLTTGKRFSFLCHMQC